MFVALRLRWSVGRDLRISRLLPLAVVPSLPLSRCHVGTTEMYAHSSSHMSENAVEVGDTSAKR